MATDILQAAVALTIEETRTVYGIDFSLQLQELAERLVTI